MSKKYFKEHPDVELPDRLLELGFEDWSWKNEEMPRVYHPEHDLTIWVASEYYCQTYGPTPKYSSHPGETMEHHCLCTDDLEEVLKHYGVI